jgi:hypothetical protein
LFGSRRGRGYLRLPALEAAPCRIGKDREDRAIPKMMDQSRLPRRIASAALPFATAALAAVIFVAQAMTSEKLTAALFYVLVVLVGCTFL